MTTITDVAARAGVARSTVSYVLNGQNTAVRISDETRRRVMQAAAELGYRRNELARAVITGKHRMLGFWVTHSEREPAVRVLAGAMKEAQANKYFIKMLGMDDDRVAESVAEHSIEWRLSGIIAINALQEAMDQVVPQISQFEIPMVLVESQGAYPGCMHVTSEAENGIRAAVLHLAGLGHKRIAFLSGTPNERGTISGRREAAYVEAMRDLGLGAFADMEHTYWDFHQTELATQRLMWNRGEKRPTAVCCIGDHAAMLLIRTAAKMGLQVPADLSVVGFDDLAVAAMYNPSLTTVIQPFEDMGRLAVRRLLQAAEHSVPPPLEERLPTRLVIRESTAPPKLV